MASVLSRSILLLYALLYLVFGLDGVVAPEVAYSEFRVMPSLGQRWAVAVPWLVYALYFAIPPTFWSHGWRRVLKITLAVLAVLFVSNAVFVGDELGVPDAPLRRVFGWVWLLLPVVVLLCVSRPVSSDSRDTTARDTLPGTP